MEAVRKVNLEMIRLLLDNGADVNEKDGGDVESALRIAEENGYKGVIELLKAHGAKE
jgi:hypothetical protein